MNTLKLSMTVFIGLILSISIALSGFFVGHGIYKSRALDRYVTVKGLVEKRVQANIAQWDIDYRVTGDDLQKLSDQMAHNQKLVFDFLSAHGFKPEEMNAQAMSVIDQYAKEYGGPEKPTHRYIIKGGVTLRSSNVDLVKSVSQLAPSLIEKGIALAGNDYDANPKYMYTQLDQIRPELLREATQSARRMAQQFALDSNSQLAGIRRANQGQFQVLDKNGGAGGYNENQLKSIVKTIRVVSSIDYYLVSK